MDILSWNINGIRAVMRKGFGDIVDSGRFDVLCLQETRIDRAIDFDGYAGVWAFSEKKGYAGVAILTQKVPDASLTGTGDAVYDTEGRVAAVRIDGITVVSTYFPTSGADCMRLPYRVRWESAFRNRLASLIAEGPVIVLGDLNVAPDPRDVWNPDAPDDTAGRTPKERSMFRELLGLGLVDLWRDTNLEERSYTWWSSVEARRMRRGMRLDHALATRDIAPHCIVRILDQAGGSDHCPLSVNINI